MYKPCIYVTRVGRLKKRFPKAAFFLYSEGCFLISFRCFLFGARREGIGHAVSDQGFSEQGFLSLPLGYSFGFESAEPLARLIGD